MGKSYMGLKINNLPLEPCFKLLFSGKWEVIEASEERYFYRIPSLVEISDIEVGCDGTKESILRLKTGGFVVINKTIDLKVVQ